jgi:D-tyrosyl-tRNA(Tyr) deacylase
VRALVQRVASASVAVDGREVSRIGAGMLVLLGVADGDGDEEADRIVAKLTRLRIFEDAAGRTNEALGEREILCVSQFTLLADVSKGNRPSFTGAAGPEVAEALYERVCEGLGAKRGQFGARMTVELVNEGPFTLLVEA